jgi:hypothetical protein
LIKLKVAAMCSFISNFELSNKKQHSDIANEGASSAHGVHIASDMGEIDDVQLEYLLYKPTGALA